MAKNNNKHHVTGLDLAKFLVEECYAFLGELKEKLDGMDETLPGSTALQISKRKRQKVVDPNRKKRILVPFNLFVKQEIAKAKADGSHAPEGEKEGGWLMRNAAAKWSKLSQAEKDAYAASVKVTLDEMNNGAAATLAPALAEPFDSLKLPSSPNGKKQKRKTEDVQVGIQPQLGDSVLVSPEGEVKRKKKKKKKKQQAEEVIDD